MQVEVLAIVFTPNSLDFVSRPSCRRRSWKAAAAGRGRQCRRQQSGRRSRLGAPGLSKQDQSCTAA
eukprot:3308997-Pyramimonas_sp.AAC.1